jgi:preprotein translocase subunit SecA
MRLFGSERISRIMTKMGVEEGEVISHSMITKSVERAQKKVEENNFGIRKRLLEYDDVMNQQRTVIYSKRKQALIGENMRDEIAEMLGQYAEDIVAQYWEDEGLDALREELRRTLVVDIDFAVNMITADKQSVRDLIVQESLAFLKRKEKMIGVEAMQQLERMSMLQVIDIRWKEHLREMDDLKEGIHMRAYGQKDPLIEYKREAFEIFVQMLGMINQEVLGMVFRLFPAQEEQMPRRVAGPRLRDLRTMHSSSEGMGFRSTAGAVPGVDAPAEAHAGKPQPIRVEKKVGRNEPCPCGSGKKFKNCHGQ